MKRTIVLMPKFVFCVYNTADEPGNVVARLGQVTAQHSHT